MTAPEAQRRGWPTLLLSGHPSADEAVAGGRVDADRSRPAVASNWADDYARLADAYLIPPRLGPDRDA